MPAEAEVGTRVPGNDSRLTALSTSHDLPLAMLKELMVWFRRRKETSSKTMLEPFHHEVSDAAALYLLHHSFDLKELDRNLDRTLIAGTIKIQVLGKV